MTPEQIEEFNRRTKGDPMAMATELVKVINGLEAENKRLHEKITAAQTAISGERNFAMLRLDTDTAPGIVLLDTLRAVEDALAGPLPAAVDGTR